VHNLDDQSCMELEKHKPAWVRVNVQVDEGIAEVVSLLGEIEELETVESCQGCPTEAKAFVYFHYGDWERLCRFMFVTLAPRLDQQIGQSALTSVEVFNGSVPLGKISFNTEAIPIVASVLRDITQERQGVPS